MSRSVSIAIVAALGALLCLGSCATTKRAGVCPEHEDLKCLTKVECTFDSERGCDVCQCSSPLHGGELPPKEAAPDPPR